LWRVNGIGSSSEIDAALRQTSRRPGPPHHSRIDEGSVILGKRSGQRQKRRRPFPIAAAVCH